MSWSLKIRNGDLVLGTSSYGIVKNEDKLIQDLRLHILEEMGTDDTHLSYGSLINGGRLPDGTHIKGVIGESDPDIALLEVEQEVRRIIGEYQQKQLDRVKLDKIRHGKSTLTKSEVLISLKEILPQFSNDTLFLNIIVETGGREASLNFTVQD